MIRALSIYFGGISPVFIDGLTYVLIAFFGAVAAALSSDEAAKFITPTILFWSRTVCQAIGAALLALKMFRSTSFAEHVEQKKQETKPSDPQI